MIFATIENVVDRKVATLLKSLCSIKSVYTNLKKLKQHYTWTMSLRFYTTINERRESPSTLPQPMNTSYKYRDR